MNSIDFEKLVDAQFEHLAVVTTVGPWTAHLWCVKHQKGAWVEYRKDLRNSTEVSDDTA